MFLNFTNKGRGMKKILFKKTLDPQNRIKSFSIKTNKEDKDSKTEVEKGFSYHLFTVEQVEPTIEPPQIQIYKEINHQKRIEKFSLAVEGYFYVTRDRMLLKVAFHHTLNIQIYWKRKIFSPKKSEVLTK